MMLRFHCFVHGAPEGPLNNTPVSLAGREILSVQIEAPPSSLPVTFDHAAAQLSQIEGLHFEPDGWFLWGQGAGPDRWQVNGQLTDGGARLEFVELHGSCPEEALDVLLNTMTRPPQAVLLQLVLEGVYVDLATLKQICREDDAPQTDGRALPR
jgi:hypothetical protein